MIGTLVIQYVVSPINNGVGRFDYTILKSFTKFLSSLFEAAKIEF